MRQATGLAPRANLGFARATRTLAAGTTASANNHGGAGASGHKGWMLVGGAAVVSEVVPRKA